MPNEHKGSNSVAHTDFQQNQKFLNSPEGKRQAKLSGLKDSSKKHVMSNEWRTV